MQCIFQYCLVSAYLCENPYIIATSYTVGFAPTSVTRGYFRNDIEPDLTVANYGDNTVSVLFGNVDGTFQTQYKHETGSRPVSVISGDFNNDTKLDLAVANSADNTVSVLLGNGDGTFQTQMNYTVGTTPSYVTSGDFNNDKKLD